ncbi:hypothetical protein GWP85_16970 [Acinetobacter beijerinckii]|uniref:hypothetical protein n=1 Tax=Acinetobacter beijerinckii TaxID=262668 RepID=UPI0023DD7504|nr:hypothetical protein [Acinetobacter beijerinckii]MDF2419185.1 hypothetical protein [Acinetobacter beijerinckii]
MEKITLLLFIILMASCSNTEVMSGEFSSMDSCLLAIEKKSGKQLEIVTDKLGDISGTLKGTKLGFQCKTNSTGSKGLVVNGWYQIEK